MGKPGICRLIPPGPNVTLINSFSIASLPTSDARPGLAAAGCRKKDRYPTAGTFFAMKAILQVQSSQVNENGPRTVIRGTKATINLSDEWEGPPSRQYDYADIVPESPFAAEFAKKYTQLEMRVDGVGNEGDLKHVDNFLECVRSRQQLNCNFDIAFKALVATDLSVRSYRNGKVYYFDAEHEKVLEKS